MSDHITNILDEKPIAALNESELNAIGAHVEVCDACHQALQAARISALLLSERAAVAADSAANANPFFQTRVMAAWREGRADSVSALRRLWNATGALVGMMAATTAALAVLAFVAPADTVNQPTAAMVPYSAESVVLDQNDDVQMTDDQVFSAIYAEDDDGK